MDRSRVIRWLVANWPLKLASVAAGMALWAFVVATERTRVVLTVPVEYVGIGQGRLLIGPRQENLDVEFEAVRWVASRLLATGVSARVSLADLPEGESMVSVSPSDIRAPPGSSITRVTPARVRVSLAAAGRRTVRVAPEIHGRPAPGFAIERVSAEPAIVQIEGPQSTIETDDVVATEPVDVTGARVSLTRTVALELPADVATLGERTARVTVVIRAEDEMQHKGARR
jgi:hypothetical protein